MVAEMLAKGPDAMKEIMRDQPIARLGQPEEIAAAVLWLCSSGTMPHVIVKLWPGNPNRPVSPKQSQRT
jgi:NAD(P)-dependent dehydrogenase (short-subunit alcohol dehydrogenase family)